MVNVEIVTSFSEILVDFICRYLTNQVTFTDLSAVVFVELPNPNQFSALITTAERNSKQTQVTVF